MKNRKLGIFEPLHAEGQTLCEKDFIALRLKSNEHAHWREFRILLDFYYEKKHETYDYSGIISPKFTLKTLISGKSFIDFINKSDEADVYIINAFPPLAYISYNVWMHGEAFHPGITERTQKLLDVCNIKIDLKCIPRHSHRTLCYSNFWIGTPNFWKLYAETILIPIEQYLLNNPESDISRSVLEDTTHTDPAPFLPFIIERLFSTFISMRNDITIVAYPFDYKNSRDYCLNDFETEVVKCMGKVIDKADSDDSYPNILKDSQYLYTKLYKNYFSEYYSIHPHPHTGYTASLFKKK
ncbi:MULTISPECIES: hypothetical protein [Rahnella]|uniref:DUF4422 domain-containing protein n=1 Tax=Rahnella laticis TaxID=2787622 RepID=A0ABS0E885_9GAMM|nr:MULTISPECIES: hypothetical protein [Rahnella]MBF7980250.1 hypothetical protein [Rahnella laticis]MBF8000491.1 hypothetical protein [Rahnella sp. LAC-M12]